MNNTPLHNVCDKGDGRIPPQNVLNLALSAKFSALWKDILPWRLEEDWSMIGETGRNKSITIVLNRVQMGVHVDTNT